MSRCINYHGGAPDLVRAVYPAAPGPWIDLSTGINPFPYPYTDYERTSATHLPTVEKFSKCRAAMANAIGASEESILLAPGSELLIRLLPTLLSPGSVTVASESYADHFRAWSLTDAHVIATLDPLQCIDDSDVIVVCNPNNPDGRTWSPDNLLDAARILARKGGFLIIDEAYADLDPALSLSHEAGADGLLILRSIGKFYGLAGIRLGAILGPESILDSLANRLGVWPVPGPTLDIAAEAYADAKWQEDTRTRLSARRMDLDRVLDDTNVRIVGGTDLFRFIWLPDAGFAWHTFAANGIYVRKFDWSDNHLRIGLPACDQELQRFGATLATISP